MANPMTAREAWEIVQAGEPIASRMRAPDWLVASNRYARACAIVEAKINEHELTVRLESDPENIQLLLARGRAYLEVRALERGEGASK